jgi:outer membrane protein
MEQETNSTEIKSDNSSVNTEDSCHKKKCRCCLSFILNIISLTGVIVLFVLYFISPKQKDKMARSTMNIGFVNSDSVMVNYEMVKDMKTVLEAKQSEAENSYATQQKTFEAQVAQYQKNVQANTLSIADAQKTEKYLTQAQQNLLDLKEKLTSTLADEEMKMNVALMDSIMNYLKRYNKDKSYDYILGFSKGSGILYANDSLDVTKDVIEALNKEYALKKPEK